VRTPRPSAVARLVFLALWPLACLAVTDAQTPGTDVEPGSGLGWFQARLDGDTLSVTLPLYYDFVDGDERLAPGFAPEEYRWTAAERTRFEAEFGRHVATVWSRRYALESTGGARRVAVDVAVTPVARRDDAHWVVFARHYPDDALDTVASVCDPGWSHFAGDCEYSGERWGTVEVASTHLHDEYLLPWEVSPTDLWFERGSTTPEASFADDPAVRLFTDAGWNAELIGFADRLEVDPPVPGAARPTIALARRRTQYVRDTLIAEACRPGRGRDVPPDCETQAGARIRVVNQGAYGDAPYEDRALVELDVFRTGNLIDTPAHEAGHMLGLEDEASLDELGDPVALPAEYQDWVFDHAAALGAWTEVADTWPEPDDEGIMGLGRVVRPRHYLVFVDAMEALTGSPGWRIVAP